MPGDADGADLSALPQVATALAGLPSGELVDGANKRKEPVRSVHVAVPALGWQVFVDLPAAETSALFWGAVMRGASLLGLGLGMVAAVLAILLAVRPVTISGSRQPRGGTDWVQSACRRDFKGPSFRNSRLGSGL